MRRTWEDQETAGQGGVLLTDLLTRRCGTAETQRETKDGDRLPALVSETHQCGRDKEDVRHAAHNPATTGAWGLVSILVSPPGGQLPVDADGFLYGGRRLLPPPQRAQPGRQVGQRPGQAADGVRFSAEGTCPAASAQAPAYSSTTLIQRTTVSRLGSPRTCDDIRTVVR